MSGGDQPNELIQKYSSRIFIGAVKGRFMTLVERFGLSDGFAGLIAILSKEQASEAGWSDQDIELFCQTLVVHTNPTRGIGVGDTLVPEEADMLIQFGWSLMKGFIRKHPSRQREVVRKAEIALREICEEMKLPFEEFSSKIRLERLLPSDHIASESDSLIRIPSGIPQGEALGQSHPTYFAWANEYAQLEALAGILEERAWIVSAAALVNLMDSTKSLNVVVTCRPGYHYHFALLIDSLKRNYALKVEGEGVGHFKLAQEWFLDKNGKAIHSRWRSLPCKVFKNRADENYARIIKDVHDVLDRVGLQDKQLCNSINCKSRH